MIRDLFVTLEDRRTLVALPTDLEDPDHVLDSVKEIREALTLAAKSLDEESAAAEPIRTMRDTCARFLHGYGRSYPIPFLVGLGRLQAVFGSELETLSEIYEVDLPSELNRLAPPSAGEGLFLARRPVAYPSGRYGTLIGQDEPDTEMRPERFSPD